MMPDSEFALRMQGIEKRFGAVQALAGVDLAVRPGEVHALIGENGAGKSTLMKILSGALRPDAGSMQLAGSAYAPAGPLAARTAGVAMMYQELALAPHLSVEENMLLGCEPRRLGIVDRRERRRRVEHVLTVLDQPELSPERRVADLSLGARQLVEAGRALLADARVLVMDEPTSALARADAERLFAVIERLRARGVAVLYISHFFEEVERVAQRYTVLRDGRSVASGEVPSASDPDSGFAARIIEALAGRRIDQFYPRTPHQAGDVVLELESVSGLVRPSGASLALRKSEILGIAGLVGAGRSELLRALFGLEPIRSGSVRIAGQPAPRRHPWERLAQGIGLLSENRKDEGLALNLSIATNVTLSAPLARMGVVLREKERVETERLARRLALRYRDPDQPVTELSGGNQQKVALARLLHHDVDVLLLDEPTRGVDVGSKAECYQLIGELAAAGKAVLLVSSYPPELLGVCDRIAVMRRGRLGAARPVSEWTEHSLLEAMSGGADA